MRTTGLRTPAAGRGFTLIELLLTIVLLMLLISAAVINFSSLQTSVQLDEGAEQFESAIRFARAHAASTGCKVRLTFEEKIGDEGSAPLGNLFAEWEPDPLRKPGVFEPLRQVAPLLESMLEAVEIENVFQLDASGAAVEFDSEDPFAYEDELATMFAPITFYPDGSSDSSEIILVSRAEGDGRRISVKLLGVTGAIQKRVITEDEPVTDEEFWMDFE